MFKRLVLAWAVLLGVCFSALADTSVVTFPTLPDGSSWVTALTTIFVSAAGLGLGIIGLKLVIRMIRAGLRK